MSGMTHRKMAMKYKFVIFLQQLPGVMNNICHGAISTQHYQTKVEGGYPLFLENAKNISYVRTQREEF